MQRVSPAPPVRRPAIRPVFRIAQLVLGGVLILAAPLLAPVPGPAGIFLLAGGLVLILRNSPAARLRFARAKRKWPRTGRMIDRAMRRESALRRLARERQKVRRDTPR